MLLGAVQVCGHSPSMTDSDVHDFDRVALWPMIHCCSLKDYMIHLAGKSQISPQKGYGYYSSPTSSNDGMRRTTHLEMTTTTCLATKGTQGTSIGNAIRTALTARGRLLTDSECRGSIFRKRLLLEFQLQLLRAHIFLLTPSQCQHRTITKSTTRMEG